MWIEFDNLWVLENKIKSAAFLLRDTMEALEKQLRGGNIPYKKVDNYILVDEAVFDKFPEARTIYEAHQSVYKAILDQLNIVEELPYQPNLSGVAKQAKKPQE